MNVAVHRTIRDILPAEWNSCFPGDPERWAYYCAVEDAGLDTFSWIYLAVREHDRVVAVAPAFVTNYGLDTTVQGRRKLLLQPFLRRFKSLLTVRLVCLGSPLADKCHLGFAPDLPTGCRAELASRILTSLGEFAALNGIGLVAAKDVAETDLDKDVGLAFARAGFARQPSLPNAVLALPHISEDAYLKSLSPATRRDVRRKLKSRRVVQVEQCHGKEALGVVPELLQLYDSQRNRSDVDFEQFEALTLAYFERVLIELGNAAVVFLYSYEGRLIAFNLCFYTDQLFIDKFIGVALPLARELDIYVVSWMTNLRYCLEHGIPFLQTGQTGYAMKRRLGSELRRNWIFFRHRNRIVDRALRIAGSFLAPDRFDDELTHPRGSSVT